MVHVIGIMIFASAFGLASMVIFASIAPQWRRIARLAMGNIEAPFAPLSTLAHAERRIAVRRWASAPVPAPIRRLRAAA